MGDMHDKKGLRSERICFFNKNLKYNVGSTFNYVCIYITLKTFFLVDWNKAVCNNRNNYNNLIINNELLADKWLWIQEKKKTRGRWSVDYYAR